MRIAAEPFDASLAAESAQELRERYGTDTEPGGPPAEVDVFLVARADDGGVLGCGGLRRLDDDGRVELKRMYVRPRARGRGVGRALLAALEAEARALGATHVVLETGSLQPDAISLYEEAGYRPIPCFGPYAGEPLSRCYQRDL